MIAFLSCQNLGHLFLQKHFRGTELNEKLLTLLGQTSNLPKQIQRFLTELSENFLIASLLLACDTLLLCLSLVCHPTQVEGNTGVASHLPLLLHSHKEFQKEGSIESSNGKSDLLKSYAARDVETLQLTSYDRGLNKIRSGHVVGSNTSYEETLESHELLSKKMFDLTDVLTRDLTAGMM